VYLDDRTLARPRLAAQCKRCPGTHVQGKILEHSDLWAGWVDEGNIPQLDIAGNLLKDFSLVLLIYLRLPAQRASISCSKKSRDLSPSPAHHKIHNSSSSRA